MAQGTAQVLSVMPHTRTFMSTEHDALQRQLTEIHNHTRVQEAARIAELRLDTNGYLQPGGRGQNFRFTTPAFAKFCQLLAPGLYPLLDSVSGQIRVPGEAAGAYSFAEAVQLYNTVLSRRYATRVNGRARFIWNTRERLLEGVFGSRYRYMPNTEIFELAELTRTLGNRPLQFNGAALLGRRLLLRYMQQAPVFSVTLPDGVTHHYTGGMYAHNSELGGETSVRLATLLCCMDTSFSAMTSFEGTRLSHAGKDFKARVRSTLSQVILRLDGLRTLRTNMQTMARTSLNLTSNSLQAAGALRISRYLRSQGLTAGAAKAVVRGAMYHGSELAPQKGLETLVPQRVIAARTFYDLFVSLMREAQRFSVNSREALEQAAYALLERPTDIG